MAQITPGTWNLDAAHSDVDFVIRHAGISKVRGTFHTVDGQLVVAEDFNQSSVQVTVDMASINTKNEGRDQHLRSADFFDVEQFPQMTFRSTEVRGEAEDFTVVGELTIHGVTKTVELEAEFGGQDKDAFGATRVGFEAKGEISRKDFGLTWNAATEAGGVMVSDKVKIEIGAAFVLPEA
ncbi:YceI family protein [Micrococcus porci]|uniref:YceI family protein n=1 Tax=Micrococcus TaxID=1269 RepID=UPI001CCB18BC|nr:MULTISPECIES: YceI family protein [Micrococcus]MCG7423422.1 YceI family protein [Micrococcus sp. ACRRV]UBH24907.1 YceI family protein [Micrococcus porci]